jgi:hypothetical protein
VVRRLEGVVLLGRCSCRLEDNSKFSFKEVGYEDVHWIHKAQGRDPVTGSRGTVINFLVP